MTGKVCCLTKIPPFAQCIDPSQFQADNCETKPPPMPSCEKPSDCDGGTVCCLSPNAGMIACEPSGLCPGGGTNGTYLVCSTDDDCPSHVSGACMALPIPLDAGISLSYCSE